jgi:outer membrane protein assembly factor BamB
MTTQPKLAWATVTGAVLIAALITGCASSKPKPQPLEPISPKLKASVIWKQSLGKVQFPLAVATAAGQFTVASSNGVVVAWTAETGKEVWRVDVGSELAAGVGSDGRFAAVVTRDSELVVLEKGAVKWRKPLNSSVSTAPLVAGERIFVLGQDRNVQAFDALDGRKLWALQRPSDPLTLTQAGVLTVVKDTLIVGQGPRLAGLDPLRGTVRWETPVGAPRGANEIERLADLVGPTTRIGATTTVCARAFQVAVGCVNAVSGTTLWSKNSGGLNAVASDEQFVTAADASDRITAWKTANGDVAWSSDKLQHRALSAPASTGNSVVFGDEDGTLHWLARDTGEPQLRLPLDGGAITQAPVVVGTTLFVVTRRGGVFAIRP